MGPWLTTKDEITNPNRLNIRGYIDGECYTDDSTSNYFFTVERVIAEATKWFTMEPGDCLHTGTASERALRSTRAETSGLIWGNTTVSSPM